MSKEALNVLGISAFYHDSSAAIFANGEMVAFSKEERFTRIKHDANFPSYAIEFCLSEAGIEPKDLTSVVYYENPYSKFSRILISIMRRFPYSFKQFVFAMNDWLGQKLWIRQSLSFRLGISPGKIKFANHHHSHIWHSFYLSRYEKAAFLCIDAVGEWDCTSFGSLAIKNNELSLTTLSTYNYPYSLGLIYSAFTAFLGFKSNCDENSVMALASFGHPIYLEQIGRIFRFEEQRIIIDESFFIFEETGNRVFSKKFISLFGLPRSKAVNLNFDVYGTKINREDKAQYYADIASSLQKALEDTVLKVCEFIFQETKLDSLVLCGGLFQNVVLVGQIETNSSFSNIFVPPDPSDGGAAIGASLAGFPFHKISGTLEEKKCIYPGPNTEIDGAFMDIINQVDIRHILGYKFPEISGYEDELEVRSFNCFDELILEVSDLLAAHQVVGWYQNRSEGGARALGNRSILCHPSNVDSAIRIRKNIKYRASYRPFSVSITHEHYDKYIVEPATDSTKWMQTVKHVKTTAQRILAAGIHVDGTTRLQVVMFQNNEEFHKLITAFGDKTGIYGLLNTSFNESGYPLLNNPLDALVYFLRSDLDSLAIDKVLLMKKRDK